MEYNNYDELDTKYIDNKKALEKALSEIKDYNDIYKIKFPVDENLDETTEYYDVLTDKECFWVHVDDLIKICREISSNQLIGFDFKIDMDVVHGKEYVMISESFIDFIKQNTKNPKYLPNFSLLKMMSFSKYHVDDKSGYISQAITTDGTIELESEKYR